MKKTKIVLISALASVALIGTTVAAFVVDKANEQGMLISPGTISIDQDKVYTLSWGSLDDGQTAMANLPNVLPGQKYTYYVKVVASESYNGVFTYSLSDETQISGERTHKLIDALSVDFSIGDESTQTWTIPDESQNYTGSRTINAGPDGVLIKMVVSVSADADAYINDITSDVVRFAVNWNKASNDDDYTGTKFFVKLPADWDVTNVYAYAWDSSNEGSKNKAWPGVTMAKDDDSYSALINTTKYDRVIFSDGTKQTVDLALDSSKPYFTVSTSVDELGHYNATATSEYSDTKYYLVGSMNSWKANDVDYLLTKIEGEEYLSWTGDIPANTEYKVLSSLGDWVGGTSYANATINDAGKYKISLDLTGSAFGGTKGNNIYDYLKAESVQ